MLGGQLKFVSVDEIKGENAKGPYHFANAIFSDGLESIELPLDLALAPQAKQLRRGQDVVISTNIRKNGYNHSITVNSITVK